MGLALRQEPPLRRGLSTPAVHTIRNVRRGPGTLELDVRIGPVARSVWVLTSEPVVPRQDAGVPPAVLTAMRYGGTLEVPVTVSPRLLRGAGEIQAAMSAWSRTWALTGGPLREVEIAPAGLASEDVPSQRRVAAFFSGGVDSFATVLARPEITDLVFVAGFDVPLAQREKIAMVDAHLARAAADLGKRFIRVDTNLRRLTDELLDWRVVFGSGLAMVSMCLAEALGRVHISGFTGYDLLTPNGSHPAIDHHWAPEGLEIFHDARWDRAQRVARIAGDPVVRRSLRVCWQHTEKLNCGICRKCLATMAPLDALGALEMVETFPALDLGRLAAVDVSDPTLDGFWHGNLALAREHGARKELIRALDAVTAAIRRRDRRARQRWRR